MVNTRGELVGINTMISSPTGSYAGYSFAIPSNITRKIIEDLMQFGNVQRGILGVQGQELNSAVADKIGISKTQGFYVNSVTAKSGAEKAGVKEGDIIIKLDNHNINSFAELSAYINTKRPDDVVNVTVLRNENEKVIPVKLSKRELLTYEVNGFEFEDLSTSEKKEIGMNSGVKIKSITNEDYAQYADELTGSIVIAVDGKKVNSSDALIKYIKGKGENSRTQYELLLPNGQRMRAIF